MKEPQSVQNQLHVSLRLEAVQLLVELGAELNATWLRGAGCDTAPSNPGCRFQVRNGAGETPLMLVCRKGHAQAGLGKKLPVQPAFCDFEAAKFLLEMRADAEARGMCTAPPPSAGCSRCFCRRQGRSSGTRRCRSRSALASRSPKIAGDQGQGPPLFGWLLRLRFLRQETVHALCSAGAPLRPGTPSRARPRSPAWRGSGAERSGFGHLWSKFSTVLRAKEPIAIASATKVRRESQARIRFTVTSMCDMCDSEAVVRPDAPGIAGGIVPSGYPPPAPRKGA